MKALQSSRLLEVVCQPRFPSLKTILLTKSPSLDWGNNALSSSLQDSTPSKVGCRSRWELEANLDFPGALPLHLNKIVGQLEKKPAQPLKSSFAWYALPIHSDNALNTSVQFRPSLIRFYSLSTSHSTIDLELHFRAW